MLLAAAAQQATVSVYAHDEKGFRAR